MAVSSPAVAYTSVPDPSHHPFTAPFSPEPLDCTLKQLGPNSLTRSIDEPASRNIYDGNNQTLLYGQGAAPGQILRSSNETKPDSRNSRPGLPMNSPSNTNFGLPIHPTGRNEEAEKLASLVEAQKKVIQQMQLQLKAERERYIEIQKENKYKEIEMINQMHPVNPMNTYPHGNHFASLNRPSDTGDNTITSNPTLSRAPKTIPTPDPLDQMLNSFLDRKKEWDKLKSGKSARSSVKAISTISNVPDPQGVAPQGREFLIPDIQDSSPDNSLDESNNLKKELTEGNNYDGHGMKAKGRNSKKKSRSRSKNNAKLNGRRKSKNKAANYVRKEVISRGSSKSTCRRSSYIAKSNRKEENPQFNIKRRSMSRHSSRSAGGGHRNKKILPTLENAFAIPTISSSLRSGNTLVTLKTPSKSKSTRDGLNLIAEAISGDKRKANMIIAQLADMVAQVITEKQSTNQYCEFTRSRSTSWSRSRSNSRAKGSKNKKPIWK